ncbi:MAG: DeoR family transcriptional regulator [Desulfuromonadales bacterium]|nr:DeoR family transcriptional regulator [Desulfuromonadales bacterium]
MKGTERRRELLAWLEAKESLSLAEIVARFGVSKMTAHRDLDILEKRQALKRIHGGAIASKKSEGIIPTTIDPAARRRDDCLICQRPVSQHLLYSLTTIGSDQRPYCCPHCGVSAQLANPEQTAMAMATDFLTGRPHPAQHSWFVLGSVVVPCCHPSMLTFEDEAMARRFQTGFGGRLGRLSNALAYLQDEMRLHHEGSGCPHCAAADVSKENEQQREGRDP